LRREGDEIDEGSLAGRVEPFGMDRIPPGVLTITAGVDVQQDRFEVTFAGWDKAGTCYVLAHVVLHRPVTDETVWQDLDDALKQRWHHPHGGTIGVDAAAIDAGDGHTNGRASRRVFAVKGCGGFGRPFFKLSTALKSRGAQRLYLIGVDSVKLAIFERLKRGQTVRFSDSLDEGYFEQLASERLITKFARGRPERRFERIPRLRRWRRFVTPRRRAPDWR
jgi:phage terminase large subunit GpA-like protein